MTLNVANKIFVQNNVELKTEFKSVTRKYFHSEVQQVNFANRTEAVGIVNQWADSTTNHKIQEIIKEGNLHINNTFQHSNSINRFQFNFTNRRWTSFPFIVLNISQMVLMPTLNLFCATQYTSRQIGLIHSMSKTLRMETSMLTLESRSKCQWWKWVTSSSTMDI